MFYSANMAHPVNSMDNERPKRQLGAIAMAIPAITEFMGSILRPLISSVSQRAGNNDYKNNLLTKLTHRVLQNTPLTNSNIEEALINQLNQNKYTVAKHTLKSKETPLSQAHYIPETWDQETPKANTMPPRIYRVAKRMFIHLTTTIDNLVKKRLRSASQISTSFVGTIIEGLRLKIQQEHHNQTKASSDIKRQLDSLTRMVTTESEETDLKIVYICLGVIMGMICIVLWASSLVRNGVIHHLMKMQIRSQPRPGRGDSIRSD